MCDKRMIEDVNIKGTQNIVRACQKLNVKRLIYVSTYNVVVRILFFIFSFVNTKYTI
jgi:nucleoside-diphosphate-sugar epimerase